MNQDAHYTTAARILHWGLAALIIAQLALAQYAERLEQSDRVLERLAVLANHKSLGLTILLLVLLRVFWRLRHRPPALPAHTSAWQRFASRLSHRGLYVLMLGLPLSGLIMSGTSAYGLSWFNLVEIPRFMAQNENANALSKDVHAVLGYALFALLVLHLAAAAYHALVLKDGILKRITSRATPLFFGAILIGTLMLLIPNLSSDGTRQAAQPLLPNESTPADTPLRPVGALWDIDYEQSFIRFTAEQAGAAFTGEWQKWQAELSLDQLPESVSMNVTINVDTPDTSDEDRDQTLQDAEWFDASSYPVARFTLDNATPQNDDLVGTATLTLKQQSYPVTFTFRIEQEADISVLTGEARLDRLQLNIGTGEWADTSWVGQYVDVEVRVVKRSSER